MLPNKVFHGWSKVFDPTWPNVLCTLLRFLATTLANSVMVVAIDGLDQSKFRAPRTRRAPSKIMCRLFRPAIHCVGAWIHGLLLNLYISNPDTKKDSNTQAEVLSLCLGEALERCSNQLPLGLHIQIDNTYREGKNSFFLSFLLLLLMKRTFRWVAVGFLRSGHSHWIWNSRVDIFRFLKLFFVWKKCSCRSKSQHGPWETLRPRWFGCFFRPIKQDHRISNLWHTWWNCQCIEQRLGRTSSGFQVQNPRPTRKGGVARSNYELEAVVVRTWSSLQKLASHGFDLGFWTWL